MLLWTVIQQYKTVRARVSKKNITKNSDLKCINFIAKKYSVILVKR